MRRPLFATVSIIVALVLVSLAVEPQIRHALFAATTPRPTETRGQLSELERSMIELFEHVSPSVVQVVALPATQSPFASDEGKVASGTGFVWDRAGHIVTNSHVVEKAAAVAVRFASGEVVQAESVGVAPNYDIAVVHVKDAKQLPAPVTIGNSADLKVGQSALAIGNPFGLDQSLTTGIISALKRRLPTEAGREISNVIQTDAAINPGNSGGPLLDSAGHVIGVTTAIISLSGSNAGIGFAIPMDAVNRIVPELIKNGRVPTPGIGIIAASEALATRMGVEGVIVIRTAPDSPAEHVGLRGIDAIARKLGDVIVAANGKPVQRLADLTDEIEQTGVGRPIRLTVQRDGSKRDVEANVADISRSSG